LEKAQKILFAHIRTLENEIFCPNKENEKICGDKTLRKKVW